jgi:wyosine [tRNA(Phe)-imidazoG37] synthetase (radical SAM superfamily)
MQVHRQAFYDPQEIWDAVQERVRRVREAGDIIDYLTFVPDGEPTLDLNLGWAIDHLQQCDLPIAVITNASLIWQPEVRDSLLGADWVSLKIDAVDAEIWRRIDRPHGNLQLAPILEGARHFAQDFRGQLVTETMLVAGVNDDYEHLEAVSDYLSDLQPSTAYLAIPTRPPAEKWVHAPGEPSLNRAYQGLSAQVNRVEYLIGYEGNAFAFTGNVAEDLLSITAVHPMREDAVLAYLARADAEWTMIDELVASGQLVKTAHDDHTFYLRRLQRPNHTT